ncbi:MAG: hypothetical protein AAF549_06040 [Pseudomonadota bacterium]
MKILGGLFTFTFIIFLSASPALAQSLCEDGTGTIPNPAPGYGVTSNMGPRNCSGCSRNHPGTDYATPIGTPLTIPEGCEYVTSGGGPGSSGYGYYIQFDCGTNSAGQRIGMQYSHLQSPNYDAATRTVRAGDTGAGGAHLDYVLTIDGNTVDAQCATGNVQAGNYRYGNSSTRHGAACPITGTPNLCDPSVANALIEHGRQARQGQTAPFVPIGTAGGGTPPAPPTGPTGQGQSGGGPSQNPDGSPLIVPGPNGGPIGNYPREPGDPRDPYVIPPEIPTCNTSTCITTETVLTAEHGYVDFQDIQTDLDRILPGNCLPPINTGLTVFRQYSGQIEEYPDRFCTNKGCSYLRDNQCVN